MADSSSSQRRAIEKHFRQIAKDYERAAKQNPIRVPIQTEASAEGGAVPGRDTTEGDPVLARLLTWLDERARQNPSHYINVARFIEDQQLHDEDATVLAFELEQRDFVKVSRNWGGEAPDIYLTDAGRAAIHRLKKLRLDRAAHLRYTMDAFHRWLFDTVGDQKPLYPVLFLATPVAYFAGSAITGTELQEALAHLTQYKLIEHIDTAPATIAITPQGVRCALAGGSVQDHVNQPRPGATYNNYLPNAKGVIIGEQRHFTQNNTDGVDPTLFAQLAGYIGQVSTTLGVSDADRAELERVAQDLHTEATSENPEPGRLRQFATQLKDKLLEAGTTIAATMGVQMADQALAALMQ
ncbi:hypothetical protein [Streptomyces tubercidicus]|uniref:hypothetical protein n=1 Tax=Streptomyces tubercidicus TaxID=47759 RepID=UPI0022B7BBC3|nr:hypothetical protein [Streptomyces tubercidicus]WAU10002.1 hypothetical protein STRTU_000041 [Streptomyces tubercidicus]